jgi:hypothetical protein
MGSTFCKGTNSVISMARVDSSAIAFSSASVKVTYWSFVNS